MDTNILVILLMVFMAFVLVYVFIARRAEKREMAAQFGTVMDEIRELGRRRDEDKQSLETVGIYLKETRALDQDWQTELVSRFATMSDAAEMRQTTLTGLFASIENSENARLRVRIDWQCELIALLAKMSADSFKRQEELVTLLAGMSDAAGVRQTTLTGLFASIENSENVRAKMLLDWHSELQQDHEQTQAQIAELFQCLPSANSFPELVENFKTFNDEIIKLFDKHNDIGKETIKVLSGQMETFREEQKLYPVIHVQQVGSKRKVVMAKGFAIDPATGEIDREKGRPGPAGEIKTSDGPTMAAF